ncbi:MAG: M81 family metallopeptidase [Planctomycetales bacterium]|nr:M81 family metallopeptidase [Planctomycetales bacterium]
MRIGIIALLHESNTFVTRPTTIEQFRENALLTTPDAIRAHFVGAHHEVGGFFDGLAAEQGVEIAPLFAARALPAGVIDRASWQQLMDELTAAVDGAGSLDGVLVAPHGATVSEDFPDADGHWLTLLRNQLGPDIPIGGTLDLHANLSPAMVNACDFLTAYRSNPHLDQRARGLEAARLMVDTVAGRIQPVLRAAFPPLVIAIDRQDTAAPWLAEVYSLAEQLRTPATDAPPRGAILSTSLLLGFPYADVDEMGAATLAVADGDAQAAQRAADQLADALLQRRELYRSELLDVKAALRQVETLAQSARPVCLLDMGDNVGGGSAADGTAVAEALADSPLRGFVCLYDRRAVDEATKAGVGAELTLTMGGKTDQRHGAPLTLACRVISLHDGRFSESKPRHGGMTKFDQGATAVVQAGSLTLMLTSKRMVPFSLQQLLSCGVDPTAYDVLVAKGVHAPLAAYREVCPTVLRVNTPGSTCADVHALTYEHRRRPLFPFEEIT